MKMRTILHELTPPILIHSLERVQARGREPEWEYLPQGWAYASTHREVKGWDVAAVLEAYKQKWPRFENLTQGTGPLGIAHESDLSDNSDISSHNTVMTFAYVLALASRCKDMISMLDWGGGVGHYYVLARELLPDLTIDYHCRDLRLLADHGARLFPGQHFYSDDSCLERSYDFVLASASLHYSEEWQSVLGGLRMATRSYLLVTRLPTVTKSPSFVFVQRPYPYGYDTEYIGWCLNHSAFLAQAEQLGLTLVREFIIGERPSIKGAPEQCQYRGFLFRG